MGGESIKTLNCSHLLSSAVPLKSVNENLFSSAILGCTNCQISLKESLVHKFFLQFPLKLLKQNMHSEMKHITPRLLR